MKIKFLGIAAVASLALAACGGSTSSSLNGYVASLGGSPNLQVTFTGDVAGPSSAKASSVLHMLSFAMNFSSVDGGNLSDSNGKANTEITVSVGGTNFFDVRGVGSNLYLKVNVTALGTIPGIKLPAAQLAAFQVLFGGRWFELPSTVLNSLVPTTQANRAKAVEDHTVITNVIDQITKIIDNAKVHDLGHGKFSETGSLLSIAKAVDSAIAGLGKVSPAAGAHLSGTYELTISTSGSTATGASVKITEAHSPSGITSVMLAATFAHANNVVSAPSGATLLSKSMLGSLFSSARH